MKPIQIDNLVSALNSLATVKTASAAENLKDPAEVGIKTDSTTDVQKTNGSDASGQTANLPSPGASQPAAEAKVNAGDVAGEVPPAKPFVEDAPEKYADLRNKLASLTFDTLSAAPAAPATADENAVMKWASAQGLPTPDANVASAVVGIIANVLAKSATGRQLIEDLVAEHIGAEQAVNFVKFASESVEAFEAEALAEMEKAAYEQELFEAAQAAYAEQAHNVQELIKSAANEEEATKIRQSIVLLKTAEAKYEDHPTGHHFFTLGCRMAERLVAMQKAAAEAGAPQPSPEEMEQMLAAETGMEGAPSIDEVLIVLEQMVQAGEISPEQAQQVAEALMAGEGGAEGMPPGMEGMPPGMEDMPPEEMAGLKAASEQHLGKVAAFVAAVAPDA
jgi:polyhydroxyalkanoate synthesis regulator phasin